jgi:hypothetical protein
MPEEFIAPTLVTDVEGPDAGSFTPARAMATIMQISHTMDDRVLRGDIGTLALLYSLYFSPVFIPLRASRDALYALEAANLISLKWFGEKAVKVTVLAG